MLIINVLNTILNPGLVKIISYTQICELCLKENEDGLHKW